MWFYNTLMCPKYADGTANSVDPDLEQSDQGRSSLISVYTVCPDLSFQKLWIIMVGKICKQYLAEKTTLMLKLAAP